MVALTKFTIQPDTPKHQKCYIMVATLILALGGFLFGYNAAVVAGAILFVRAHFTLDHFQISMVVSSALFGAMLGSILSGHFTDRYGRKKVLIFASCLSIASVVGSAAATSFEMLIIMRLAVGLTMGMVSYIVPLYISEIAPYQRRGGLVTWNQLFVTIGILCAYIANYVFAFDVDWRSMLLMGAAPSVLLFFGTLFLPESPRWLVMHNREEAAYHTLTKLRASSYVLPELQEIKESLQLGTFGWRDLFKAWLWSAVLVGFGLAILQQITGIGVILYYAPMVFEHAGVNQTLSVLLATLGLGAVNVLFTCIALPLLDRWGRRPLLFLGLAIMAVGLGLVAAAFWFMHNLFFTDPAVTFLGLFLCIVGFAIGLGPVVWLLLVEIFPLRLRGVAVSWAVFLIGGTKFLVAFTALPMIQTLSAAGTFTIYCAFCLLGLFFVAYFMPETRGATLEQIERNLRSGKKARQLGD